MIVHPYRRIHLFCKTCGIPIIIEQKHVDPEGNYCRLCICKTVNRNRKISEAKKGKNHPMFGKHHTKDSLEKMSKRHKEIYQNPNEINKLKESHLGKHFTDNHRKNLSISKKGELNPSWKGGIHPKKYCYKFNTPLKERVRAFQGYRCALCGHIWEVGEIALSVHHVHNNKDSCCHETASKIFVCLCSRGCHHKTIGKEPLFATRFIRYLSKNFNGKCYYTKEEMEQIRDNNKKDINAYTENTLVCEVK